MMIDIDFDPCKLPDYQTNFLEVLRKRSSFHDVCLNMKNISWFVMLRFKYSHTTPKLYLWHMNIKFNKQCIFYITFNLDVNLNWSTCMSNNSKLQKYLRVLYLPIWKTMVTLSINIIIITNMITINLIPTNKCLIGAQFCLVGWTIWITNISQLPSNIDGEL